MIPFLKNLVRSKCLSAAIFVAIAMITSPGAAVAAAQEPTMSVAEWQQYAIGFAARLDQAAAQLGDTPQQRALAIRIITPSYLQLFASALSQGLNKQQADLVATQQIFATIARGLQQQHSAGGTGGCAYSGYGSACADGSGFSGYTPNNSGRPESAKVPSVSCIPGEGCVYSK